MKSLSLNGVFELEQSNCPSKHHRAAFTKVDVLAVVGLLALIAAIAVPAIPNIRESARRQVCKSNLRQLQQGLQSYHNTFGLFPPAAFWRAGPTDTLEQLHHSDDFTAITYQNWIQLLLPQLDQRQLAASIDVASPIGATTNATIRTVELRLAKCPGDDFNSPENAFQTRSRQFGDLRFSRGNYAINGGTHRFEQHPGSPADPAPNGYHYEFDKASREVAYWGNGIAGFNKSFALNDFTNGLTTTVAIEEVRAGVHPVDSRGVWALGQIGGSVTWAHGMNGDAGSPNDRWKNSDDIIGCKELHQLLGETRLAQLGMPCCEYIPHNDQATSRSSHAGGVHIGMMDGSVRFVSDKINSGLWHVIHSRETPREIFDDRFVQYLENNVVIEREGSQVPHPSKVADASPGPLTNSVGMEFANIPAGRFIMGLPDEEINAVFSQDGTPKPHWVEISRFFALGIHEVTQSQFDLVTNGNSVPTGGQSNSTGEVDVASSRRPACNVTWFEAQEFCQRLSRLPEEVDAGRRYRLPTEAEWEYACRSGSTDAHIFISERQPNDRSGENAMKFPPLPTSEVGSFPPNEFGIYDMRGNVWEWTADWSEFGYYARSQPHDPTGPTHGYLKVVRGSDWLYVGQGCTLAFRATEPWTKSPFIGFRVVCEIDVKPPKK